MKLNYKRTFFVGLAFLSISSFWQLYENIIPLILKNTFGFGEAVTGVLMAMDNVLALFLLPLFGVLSDKVRTPLGKRSPFIVVGTFFAVIFMIFIPIADNQSNIVFFLVSLGVVLIAMGSYRSPAVALMPDLTPKPLRSQANAVINLMGAAGAVLTLVMIKIFVKASDKPNYVPVYLSVATIMILAVVLLLITIKEKKLTSEIVQTEAEDAHVKEIIEKQNIEKQNKKMPKEVRKSFVFIMASIVLWFTAYNAVTTAFSRYAEEVWGFEGGDFANPLLVAMIAAIFSYIPIGIISSKVGRKKTIIGGIIVMSGSYFCGFLFLDYSAWINIVFAFTGIGWAAISVNSYPMVVEMCRETDIGKYTGLYYTFSMSAQVVTPILSGILLQFISYRTLFPYAVFFSLASLCTMLFVKHGDSRPVKRSTLLENFDTED